ncbi:helix-turn-helix domain-containing protein [Olivibacter ginsenosidimutans]|uniref:Helix-turn-helix domain-containing protein n=1 Tax=Olivibacter ginsenosidimutans TaxID=1176537 RepID=A0ABP9ADH0_9SPHI
MAKLNTLPTQELLYSAYLKIVPLRNGYDHLSTIPHRHDHHELIWITSGEGNHFINFKSYPFCAHRIYMLQKGHVHQIPSFDRSGWVILMGEHFIQHFFALHPEQEGNGLFDPFGLIPYIDLSGVLHKRFDTLFCMLSQLLEDQNAPRDVMFHLLSALLLLLNKSYVLQEGKEQLIPRDRQILLQFRKLLNEQYCRVHQVSFYTEKIGVNSKTINQVLLKLTDRSMHELIEDKLLSEAKMLLLTTGLTMKEIAFQLGFNDPAYFGRFFKRHTNMSPANYRIAHS